MARVKTMSPEQQALFPRPKPIQEYCDTCGADAMFFYRDRKSGSRENFCSLHVPEHFNITKPIARKFEELYLQNLENNSTGSATNAPADTSSSQ